jgi:Tol biopolymer transport system component
MSRWIPAALAAAVAALLAVPAVRHWREQPPPPPPRPEPLTAAFTPPDGIDIGAGYDYPFGLALAPDGRRLAYPAAKAGVAALWLHDLRTGDTRALPGTDGAAAPFWAADGSRIGYFAGGRLKTIDLSGDTIVDLGDAPAPRGGAFNAAGDLVFAPSAAGLVRRKADGTTVPFTTLNPAAGETAHGWPAFLADGRHVAFLVSAPDRSRAGIWVAPLDDPGSRRFLFSTDTQAIVAGHEVLFLADQALRAQQIGPDSLTLVGRAATVARSAGRGPLGQLFATAAADVAIAGAPRSPLRELRWVSRGGDVIGRAGEPVDAWDLRLAPDGRRMVVTEVDRQLRTLDVFIRTGSQPVGTRVSLSTDVDESGVWSPDGLRVAWASGRHTVMLRGAGAVLPEQTIASFDGAVQVWDWSADGRSLLIGRSGAGSGDDLWIQPPLEGSTATPYATIPFNQSFGVFSPDGRWIAYASDESGTFDIYVDSYPKPGSRIRVTTAGGTEPRWHHDGSSLYFRRGSEIHVVSLKRAAPTLEVASMDRLFDAGATIRSYDVTPDGQRFLVNLPADGTGRSTLALVTNWRFVGTTHTEIPKR